MIYKIKIERMEFRASHGCYDTEKKVGGNFTVDLTLDVEDSGSIGADDLSGALNYVEVYETVRDVMAVPSNIIENVALRILDAVRSGFTQVCRAEVTVAKLAPPLGGKAERVAVTMIK